MAPDAYGPHAGGGSPLSRAPELSFGDPQVDRAVEIAALSYGDDLMAVLAGVSNQDRRCLSAAASGLDRAGVMSLAEAAEAVGLSAAAVRVTRHRRMVAFLAAEAAVAAELGHVMPVVEAAPPRPIRTPSSHASRYRDRTSVVKTPAGLVLAPAVKPVPPEVSRKLRYVRRFLAAGWPKSTTASLFNLHPQTMDRALAKTEVARG